jgi:hypothetical protein
MAPLRYCTLIFMSLNGGRSNHPGIILQSLYVKGLRVRAENFMSMY